MKAEGGSWYYQTHPDQDQDQDQGIDQYHDIDQKKLWFLEEPRKPASWIYEPPKSTTL